MLIFHLGMENYDDIIFCDAEKLLPKVNFEIKIILWMYDFIKMIWFESSKSSILFSLIFEADIAN